MISTHSNTGVLQHVVGTASIPLLKHNSPLTQASNGRVDRGKLQALHDLMHCT